MFLDTAKEIWEVADDTCSTKKKATQVFEVYEDLFNLRQGDKSLKFIRVN